MAAVCLQAISLGVDSERSIVILTVVLAQARLAVVFSACLNCCGVELIYAGPTWSIEAEMQSGSLVGWYRPRYLHHPELRAARAVTQGLGAVEQTLVTQRR